MTTQVVDAQVRVRPARPDELDQVGELTLTAYRADRLIAADSDYALTLRDGRARAREGTVLVAVCGDDPRVLGSVTVTAPGTALAEVARAGELELRMLAVRPEARGRGIAQSLVLAAQRLALRAGRLGLALSTMTAMQAARRLYARLGFAPEPDRDWTVVGLHLHCLVWNAPAAPGPAVEAATWPPLESEDVGGLVAGFSGGLTRRANSAVPLGAVHDPRGALERVARRFAERGLPLVVRSPGAPPDPELDAALVERGLRAVSSTDVLVRDVPSINDPGSTSSARECIARRGMELEIAPVPDDAWLGAWRGTVLDDSARAAARGVMTAVTGRYLRVRCAGGDTGEVVAILRLALDGDWAAISCLNIEPRFRRSGLGRALTEIAVHEAGLLGARRVLLQVAEDNTGALALYCALGFRLSDTYLYWGS